MSKRIGVQEDLKDIRKELENRGYFVTSMDGEDLDAVIYLNPKGEMPYLSNYINMNMGFNIVNEKASILINAEGKSIDEIEETIKNRVYTPLFK